MTYGLVGGRGCGQIRTKTGSVCGNCLLFHLEKPMRAEKVRGTTECDVVASCELIAESAELAISLTFIVADWRIAACRAYTH